MKLYFEDFWRLSSHTQPVSISSETFYLQLIDILNYCQYGPLHPVNYILFGVYKINNLSLRYINLVFHLIFDGKSHFTFTSAESQQGRSC